MNMNEHLFELLMEKADQELTEKDLHLFALDEELTGLIERIKRQNPALLADMVTLENLISEANSERATVYFRQGLQALR